MGLKYTGRADELTINGKTYATEKLYKKDKSKKYAGSFEKSIPITKTEALHLMENSSIHSFEEDGEDLLETITGPIQVQKITTNTVNGDS